jgi:hypothetical protein
MTSNINPFQNYIENSVLDKNQNDFVHMQGSAPEKICTDVEIRFLSLNPTNYLKEQRSDITNLLSLDSDIICFQRISIDEAGSIYEDLQGTYAHFLYLDGFIGTLDFSSQPEQNGILIASKFSIEDVQFNQSRRDMANSSEGVFDFVIKNADQALGHIYVTHLRTDLDQDALYEELIAILERMQEDTRRVEEESIPSLLCGNFEAFECFEEVKELIGSYFRIEQGQSIGDMLLLQMLPSFPYRILYPEYAILTTSLLVNEDCHASFTILKKDDSVSILETLNNFGSYWNKNYTLICGGHADIGVKDKDGNIGVEANVIIDDETDNGIQYTTEVSAYGDTEGNVSCEASFDYSYETESGIKFTGEASTSVSRDNSGNVSTEVKGSVGVNW